MFVAPDRRARLDNPAGAVEVEHRLAGGVEERRNADILGSVRLAA
jgi:hypothetical protein